jgi:hypothetical protein
MVLLAISGIVREVRELVDLEQLQVQVPLPGAVGMNLGVDDARALVAFLVGSDHHRPCPVAEQDHHVATARREVERVAVDLGPHEQDSPVDPGPHEGIRHLEAVQEAAALLPDVVAGAPLPAVDPELGLEEHARPGELDVR